MKLRTRLAGVAIAAAALAPLGMVNAQAATPTPVGSIVVNMGRLPLLVEHEDGTQQWLNAAGNTQAGYSTAHVRRVYLNCAHPKVDRIKGGMLLMRKGWSYPWNNSFVRFYDCPVMPADQSVLTRV